MVYLKRGLVFCNELNCNTDSKHVENGQLEVRAVIIKCGINENLEALPETEVTRFQREELFKHNALQDCKQKLALTIKMSSDPNQVPGDEYIPIEHVLGANKKRIRILNPYVVRLRRKQPFQAYKLHKIDIVTGIFIETQNDRWIWNNESKRIQRDLQRNFIGENLIDSLALKSISNIEHDYYNPQSYSINMRNKNHQYTNTARNYKHSISNQTIKHDTKTREKRLIQAYNDAYSKDFTVQGMKLEQSDNDYYSSVHGRSAEKPHFSQESQLITEQNDEENIKKSPVSYHRQDEGEMKRNFKNIPLQAHLDDNGDLTKSSETRSKINKNTNYNKKEVSDQKNLLADKGEERKLALYEIGDPCLWFTTHIQLFEKLSTPEGKTLWNDLTKEETASVSARTPKWSNEEVHVRYKPNDWLSRENYALPLRSLCLVVPLKTKSENSLVDKYGEFKIVPLDDVITLQDTKDVSKRDEWNNTDIQRQKRVVVQTARALMGGNADSLKIITRGSDRYLRLPHDKLHHAQIDLEARADDNELILVGAFGRITTIVSDTSRITRSVVTVQATNTGLAAARYRVLTRDCNPEIIYSANEKSEGDVSESILLPPRHTDSFKLNLPLKNPVESAHCTVALVNEDDETVAIRNVRIKRDDRCFCVWHCECVCLSEDPKLLCRGLPEAQLTAAGLAAQEQPRHARSVCYPDVVTVNLFVTFIGVLLALFLLGLVKAFLGLILRCVASWGLHMLLQTPRKLNNYYENSLRARSVVYDKEGWPVHPDTKQRSVRLVSKPMEFILNTIFFIILPCIMISDTAKRLASYCHVKEERMQTNYRKGNTKKCFSTHDVQSMETGVRLRRRGLRRWMTPQAEELSTNIWQEGLIPHDVKPNDCMQPLLREEKCRSKMEQSSCVDSEQDDTEYVLMQMQKSRESLARSQQKVEAEIIIPK